MSAIVCDKRIPMMLKVGLYKTCSHHTCSNERKRDMDTGKG